MQETRRSEKKFRDVPFYPEKATIGELMKAYGLQWDDFRPPLLSVQAMKSMEHLMGMSLGEAIQSYRLRKILMRRQQRMRKRAAMRTAIWLPLGEPFV
ncbi:MAG: hypothetical protein PHI18_04725 [bacterium]|nr:hypothetical protein [bacterium]